MQEKDENQIKSQLVMWQEMIQCWNDIFKKSSSFSSYIFWNKKLKCSAWITFPVHLGAAEQTVNIFFKHQEQIRGSFGKMPLTLFFSWSHV